MHLMLSTFSASPLLMIKIGWLTSVGLADLSAPYIDRVSARKPRPMMVLDAVESVSENVAAKRGRNLARPAPR